MTMMTYVILQLISLAWLRATTFDCNFHTILYKWLSGTLVRLLVILLVILPIVMFCLCGLSFGYLTGDCDHLHEGLYSLRYLIDVVLEHLEYERVVTQTVMHLSFAFFSHLQMPEMSTIIFGKSLRNQFGISGIAGGGISFSIDCLRLCS